MDKKNEYYFYFIQGLMVPRKSDYKKTHNNINKYIDAVQGLSEALKKSYGSKRFEFFEKNMETAISLLRAVYARWLETEAEAILRSVKYNPDEQILQRINTFITDLLALSIEMQRAQNIEDEDLRTVSDVDKHVDMAHNISAVGTLIDEGEYEQAQNMVTLLEEYNPEEMLAPLLDLIVSQKFGEAEKMAKSIKEKHIDEIKNIPSVSLKDIKSKIVVAVDDRPEILTSITAALKEHLKVYGFTSGPQALEFMKTRIPDLFILDIDMPVFDGYTLAKTIRKNENHATTPIIFLTGNSSREHVLKAMKAGANDFIVKPANHEMLLTKVIKFLS